MDISKLGWAKPDLWDLQGPKDPVLPNLIYTSAIALVTLSN